MYSQPITHSPVPQTGSGAATMLNAATFAPAQIAAALEVLAMLPARARRDPIAQSLALQDYALDAGLGRSALVSAALHARVTALAKWTALHDPDRQSDGQRLIAAAAHFPLSALANHVGFEPGGFQEMILFIEELPW